jgi:hypothetical protein
MLRGVIVLFACLLMSVCSDSSSRATADKNDIPKDFEVGARYGAGFSPSKSWGVTIAADGKVSQQIHGMGDGTIEKIFSLSQDDLKVIIAKITESNFFAIPEDLLTDVKDISTLILSVTMNQKSHLVMVSKFEPIKDKDDVARFMRVWSEVLRKVPSPDSGQTPEEPIGPRQGRTIHSVPPLAE